MANNLYFHIGLMKTGTTKIQRFCLANRGILENRYNLFYPTPVSDPILNDDPTYRRANSFLNHQTLFLRGKHERLIWDRLAEEVSRYPGRDLLFSCETVLLGVPTGSTVDGYLSYIEYYRNRFLEYFPDHTPKLIVYLRRLDDYVKSRFNQTLKNLGDPFFREINPHLSPTYGSVWNAVMDREGKIYSHAFLSGLASLFGSDNCNVRIYDRDLLPDGDIIPDMFRIFGVDVDGLDSEAVPSNSGLPNAALPFLSVLHSQRYRKSLPQEVVVRLQDDIVNLFSRKKNDVADDQIDSWHRASVDGIETIVPGYKELFAKRPFSTAFPEAEADPSCLALFELLLKTYEQPPVDASVSGQREVAASPAQERNEPVFGMALQKAETFFIQAVLRNLGFQDSGYCAFPHFYQFYKNKTVEEILRFSNIGEVMMSYPEQVKQVAPGQFLFGCLTAESIREALGDRRILLVLRDLRQVVLAYMRFDLIRAGTDSSLAGITPTTTSQFLQSYFADRLLGYAAECVKLMDNSLPVRFEELAEPEDVSASASVVSLAQATGCAPDAVCAAVGRAHADPLVVKSRAALTLPLSAHWNKETEAIFIDKGFAEVNQKLGYK